MLPEAQAQPAIPIRPAPFPERKWARLLRDSDASSKAKLLGLLLATWANHETGKMRVSIPTLRTFFSNDKDVPVAERTIIRWRNELVKAGFLERVSKGNGPGDASEYRLRFPDALIPDIEAQESLTLPPPESLTSNVTLSAGEVQTGRPVSEPRHAKGDTGQASPYDESIAALEKQVGQSISEAGRLVLREALTEDEQGVLRCWQKAKGASSPIGMLITMVRAGDHRVPELRPCPCCGFEKPDVRDIAPDLRAQGSGPAGEFRACGDCARTHFLIAS